MKKFLAILLCLMMLIPIGSVAAFWHPPDEPDPECPFFYVLIEGEGTFPDDRFNFTEPEYHFCTDITVQVGILGVEDLYGYQFELWWVNEFFTLTGWVVEDVWADQFVIQPVPTYDGSEPYKQAVVAVAPSTGASGDIILATLTFHINNDACWAAEDVLGKFNLCCMEARDSCTEIIELCCERDGYWRFIPMQPTIYITPSLEENCVVGETFELTIMVEDIVKMKSIRFYLNWTGNWWPWLGWRMLIETSEADIVINEEVLPKADRLIDELVLTQSAVESSLYVRIKMEDDFPLINGTFWFMTITFTKKDPWYCGGLPDYYKDGHDWTTQNATTDIVFWWGYFDVLCPDLAYIYFGDYYGDHTGDRGFAIYKNAVYIFDPVPGDLDGNGIVNIIDLQIIAGMYCYTAASPPMGGWPADFWMYYYDFNGDGHINLAEIIVVAKNFGRTCEEHVIP
jgi:hypothetical protein